MAAVALDNLQKNTLNMVVAVGTVVALMIVTLLPADVAREITREHGLIETMTAAGLLACSLALCWYSVVLRDSDLASASLLVLLLGLRELDFHTKFTTMGVFKTRYYISPDVPLGEKIVVSVIMVLILTVTFRFIQRNSVRFYRGVKTGEASSIAIALAMACTILSKILDSFSEPVRFMVRSFHDDPRTFSRAIEETLECAIPLFLLVAVYLFGRRVQQWRKTPE